MRRLIFIFILIFFAGCASSGPSFLSHALNDDLQESRQLIREGHNKQAVDALTIFLEMSPKNPEGQFLRGLAYQNLEQFSLAVQDYEKVILQNPKTLSHPLKAHYNLGMIFAYKTGEPQKSLKHFDQYLSLYESGHASEQSAYEVAKIMCSLDHGEQDSSESLPSKLLEASKIQNTDDKKKYLLDLAQQYPHSPLPHYILGKTEVAAHPDQALKHFEDALNIRITCGPCHEALGDLLIQKKKIKEGQIHKKKAQLFKGTYEEIL